MFQSNGVKFPKKEKPLQGYELYTEEKFQPTEAIRKIFKYGKVKTEDGRIKKLTDAVDPYEGYFLYSVIKANNYKNILEIGMANGMSALYICSALAEIAAKQPSYIKQKPYLISIDPFQKVQWENTGLQTLSEANLLKYHSLIEELDYIALPKLYKQVKEKFLENFDLILIDGNHLFDYTILDFYYSVKMLKIGGMIIIDDIKHENTGKAYKYLKTNYQFLVELKNTLNHETQCVFIKIAEDIRPWFFHLNF
jgi:predicted O-methyltransferase YrrM